MNEWVSSVVDAVIMSGMWLLLPTGPIAAAIIAHDSSYLRHYWRSLGASMRHLEGMKRGRPVGRAISRIWLGRENEHSVVTGNCSHCGKCCLDRACIFLRWDDEGNSRCQIYRTAFWRILPCGEYPLNGDEIAQYACPSFAATSSRIIPIIPVTSNAKESTQQA